jgi:hypothetical protein
LQLQQLLQQRLRLPQLRQRLFAPLAAAGLPSAAGAAGTRCHVYPLLLLLLPTGRWWVSAALHLRGTRGHHHLQ